MKNKKTCINVIFAIAVLIFAACSNPFMPLITPDIDDSEISGVVRITIGENSTSSRTVQPAHEALAGYRLTFTPAHNPVDIIGGNFADVTLEDGTWTITATAYKSDGTIGNSDDAVASGSITITLSGGVVSDAVPPIILRPIGTGDGTLEYAITVTEAITSGYMKLWEINGIFQVDSFDDDGVLDITSSINDDCTLAAGRYIAEVKLTNQAGDVAFRREVIEIWADTTTVFEFANYQFVDPNAVLANSGATLSEIDSKLNGTAIENGIGSGVSEQNSKTYTFSTPDMQNVSIDLVFEPASLHSTVSWTANTGTAPGGTYPETGELPIDFSVNNVLWVKAVSEDGSTTRYYKFVVTLPPPPSNGSFTDTADNESGYIAGTIAWSAPDNKDGIFSYRIYFGINETTKQSSSPLHTTDSAYVESYELSRMALPVNAKYFLIYSRSETGDYPDCLAIPIVDLSISSQYGDFNVSSTNLNSDGISYDSDSNVLTISQSGLYFITGTGNSTQCIRVTGNITADIVLKDINIWVNDGDNVIAFNINNDEGITVNLTLEGTNSLRSNNYAAGLHVPEKATLVITEASTGSLVARGGYLSTGIGGNRYGTEGTITINGGTVTAIGSYNGIGSGDNSGGNGGIVSITGGVITAIGGYNGIGSGGIVSITGGVITATGDGSGTGIGGGTGGTITTIGGNAVLFASSIQPELPTGENLGPAIVYIGNDGTMYGNVSLAQDVTIPSGRKLTINDGQILTIESGYTLTNNGTIVIEDDGDIIGTVVGNQPERPAFTVSGGSDYTYTEGVLTITGDGTYVIGMRPGVTSTATNRIVVASWVNADITLLGVNIDVSSMDNTSAFDMTGAMVNLTLTGSNVLMSGNYRAGLQVPSGSTLVITEASSGSIAAAGGYDSAGIGGGQNSDGGTITINGGSVTATGYYGAGIGGGYYRAGGTITAINGNAVIFASSIGPELPTGESLGPAIIFSGNDGNLYGDVILKHNITIQNDQTLVILGGTLTIPNGITLTNNGTIRNMGTIIGRANITGSGSIIGVPPNAIPSNGSFEDADYDTSKIGGEISWTIPSYTGGISGYRIYWGQNKVQNLDSDKLTDTVIFETNSSTATTLTVPNGTELPNNATRFLIYSYNENGDSSDFLSIPIVDAIQFVDSNYGTLTVNGSGSVSYSSNLLTIIKNGDYTISGTSTADRIKVTPGLTGVNITLSDLSIDVSAVSGACALDITSAAVNLTLTGNNVLNSGLNRAGIEVPQGATLVITAESIGSLDVTGGNGSNGTFVSNNHSNGGSGGGAGIGGGSNNHGGNVSLQGGTITSTGGNGGSGYNYYAGSGGGGGGAGIGGGGGVGGDGGYVERSIYYGGTSGGNGSGGGVIIVTITINAIGGSGGVTTNNGGNGGDGASIGGGGGGGGGGGYSSGSGAGGGSGGSASGTGTGPGGTGASGLTGGSGGNGAELSL